MIASERFGFGLALLDPNIYSLAWPNRITFLELTLFMMLPDEERRRTKFTGDARGRRFYTLLPSSVSRPAG